MAEFEEKKEDLASYKKEPEWSDAMDEYYGHQAAVSFVIGAQMLGDELNTAIRELEGKSAQSTLKDCEETYLADFLPPAYQKRYTRKWLQHMQKVLNAYIDRVHTSDDLRAHTVLEEIIVKTCMDLTADYMKSDIIPNLPREIYDEDEGFMRDCKDGEEVDPEDVWNNYDTWAYDLFDDDEVNILFTCDDVSLLKMSEYAFSHWDEDQFW